MSCSKMWVQMTRFENAKYFHFTESDITYLRLIAFSFVALSFLFYSFFLHLLHFFLSHCTHSLSLAYRFCTFFQSKLYPTTEINRIIVGGTISKQNPTISNGKWLYHIAEIYSLFLQYRC